MKHLVISMVAMFVMAMGLSFVVHGVLLNADYKSLPNVYRSEEDSAHYAPFMLLAHALIAVALVLIYRRGREEKPFLMQGVRFGLLIALLSTVPTFLIYYAVQPLPGVMVVKQIVFDTLTMLVLGVTVAWLNRST